MASGHFCRYVSEQKQQETVYTISLFLSLTPRSSVLLEKPSVARPLKNFPKFYGTPRFITEFRIPFNSSLSWARWIQSIPPHYTSVRSILILSSHPRLDLPSGLFPSRFPAEILHAFLSTPTRPTCPVYLPWFERSKLRLTKHVNQKWVKTRQEEYILRHIFVPTKAIRTATSSDRVCKFYGFSSTKKHCMDNSCEIWGNERKLRNDEASIWCTTSLQENVRRT
jgi:hypothetical protein